MEINICKICKEPVWNFICQNCLAKGIASSLPREMSLKFFSFHENFSRLFSGRLDELRPCFSCGSSDAPPICIDCYMNEVHEVFKDSRPDIVKEIEGKIFHFHFKKHGEIMKMHKFQPVTEMENKETQLGICDECGEYSEELMLIDGKWVCRNCCIAMD